MWVHPKVVDATDLEPVIDVVRALQDLPPAQLERIFEELCAEQEHVHPGAACRMRAYWEQGKREGSDLAVRLIRIAASNGAISLSALREKTDSAFRVRTFAFSHGGTVYDAEQSIEDGIFLLASARLRSADKEVNDRPLLMRAIDSRRLLRRRPPRRAEIESEANALVRAYQARGQIAKKADFLRELIERVPGCSKEAAKRARATCVPNDWKRPGRRGGTI